MTPQQTAPDFQRLFSPPPPPSFDELEHPTSFMPVACVMCDTRGTKIPTRGLKRAYVPPAAYLGVFLGPLLGLLLIMALRVQHEVNLPFCDKCWGRSKRAGLYETFAGLSFILALIVG